MQTNIRNLFSELNKMNSDWEKGVLAHLRGDSTDIDGEQVVKFYNILEAISRKITSGELDLDKAVDMFSDELKPQVEQLLNRRLRPYFACAFIRKAGMECQSKLENLIDDAWKKVVVRDGGAFSVKKEEIAPLSALPEEIQEFAVTLEAVTYHCIGRLLTYEATIDVFVNQMGISKDLCEYIARKINREEDALRINYIIKQLANK